MPTIKFIGVTIFVLIAIVAFCYSTVRIRQYGYRVTNLIDYHEMPHAHCYVLNRNTNSSISCVEKK